MSKASFYLITDSHYVSPQNWVEAPPINRREGGDQIALKATPQILDTFLDRIIADTETDTVVFTGDNVDDGDVTSHNEFRERLERLVAAGKKVYVTTATHDYCGAGDDENGFMAKRFTETGTEPIPFMRKADLFDFYSDYGPKQAISVDKESGSYVVKLCDGVRLVMIEDNGNGRSHCGLFEEGVAWLRAQLLEARDAGDCVLLTVHHPVIAPWPVFAHVAEHELYGGYKEMWDLMCETGARVVFTGHTHVQSIRRYTDDQGRWFLNIATIALANAAGKMRHVTVDSDTGMCRVTSVGVGCLNGETEGKTMYERLYHINFPGVVEEMIPAGAEDPDAFLELGQCILPVDKLSSHKLLIRKVCRKALKMKLSTVAKFGGGWKRMTPEQKEYAKKEPLFNSVRGILSHIYTGDAPYTPDTAEYVALDSAVVKVAGLVDKFRIEKVKGLIPPGSSLPEMARDFLYNNRTGSDNEIEFSLR